MSEVKGRTMYEYLTDHGLTSLPTLYTVWDNKLVRLTMTKVFLLRQAENQDKHAPTKLKLSK